jgi:spore maturation protein CgeB
MHSLDITILGLSLSSSWGNGHATTFRGLIKELHKQGHRVTFLERDVPWYSGNNRDLPNPDFCKLHFYKDLNELKDKHVEEVKEADLVIVGSYVPQGVEVGEWVIKTAQGVKAFYDIDTPVTMAKLNRQDFEYLTPDLIAKYDLYLSFTGGPLLDFLENNYKSPCARPLYCSVDPDLYYPEKVAKKYNLGYLGTYSQDRQPPLDKLMIHAAKKWRHGNFVVAGPQYPSDIAWPENVERIDHLPPSQHRKFYNSQQFTLNITRADMIKWGFSPSVRLFEAAACGVPIISDYWDGLDTLFQFGEEILISQSSDDTLKYLTSISEEDRAKIGENARNKILSVHTASHRAKELVTYALDLIKVPN